MNKITKSLGNGVKINIEGVHPYLKLCYCTDDNGEFVNVYFPPVKWYEWKAVMDKGGLNTYVPRYSMHLTAPTCENDV